MHAHKSDYELQPRYVSYALPIPHVSHRSLRFVVQWEFADQIASGAGENKLDRRTFAVFRNVRVDTP